MCDLNPQDLARVFDLVVVELEAHHGPDAIDGQVDDEERLALVRLGDWLDNEANVDGDVWRATKVPGAPHTLDGVDAFLAEHGRR